MREAFRQKTLAAREDPRRAMCRSNHPGSSRASQRKLRVFRVDPWILECLAELSSGRAGLGGAVNLTSEVQSAYIMKSSLRVRELG